LISAKDQDLTLLKAELISSVGMSLRLRCYDHFRLDEKPRYRIGGPPAVGSVGAVIKSQCTRFAGKIEMLIQIGLVERIERRNQLTSIKHPPKHNG
jgi:hypothetical protein